MGQIKGLGQLNQPQTVTRFVGLFDDLGDLISQGFLSLGEYPTVLLRECAGARFGPTRRKRPLQQRSGLRLGNAQPPQMILGILSGLLHALHFCFQEQIDSFKFQLQMV